MSEFKTIMRFLLSVLFLLLAPVPQVFAQSSGHSLDDDLLYRINFGSAEDVKLLLERGADPNARNKQGEAALEVAIQRNDSESQGIALALIDKGATIDIIDKLGNPPIIDAIRYRQSKVVREMLNRGVDFRTKSSDGIPLIEYAKVDGDPETIKLIQDLIDKEAAYIASLKDPAHFKDVVKEYANGSCLYQYWDFFLTSRQDPERDEDTKKKIATIKKDVTRLSTQIQQYYPSASMGALKGVSNKAVTMIYGRLKAMVSNRNRAEIGVGTDEDAKRRCDRVIEAMRINAKIADMTSKGVQSAPPPHQPHTAAPPLPMDGR